MFCNKCGLDKPEDEFAIDRSRKRGRQYNCKQCHRERLAQRARDFKQRLVDLSGGRCSKCGYDRCIAALDFHHRDPSIKEFNLKTSVPWDRLVEEAKKCDLLCANCHREEHYKHRPVAQLGA